MSHLIWVGRGSEWGRGEKSREAWVWMRRGGAGGVGRKGERQEIEAKGEGKRGMEERGVTGDKGEERRRER